MAKGSSDVPLSPFDDLHLALAKADSDLAAADTPKEERDAALLALAAIYDFLKSAGLRSKALNNLSMALQDIRRGNAPALFAPSIQNRPKETAKLFILKASAAAAMQLAMDSGHKKDAAAAFVARRLLGFKPASKGAIARWRDRFSGHSDEEGADIYRFVLQEVRAAYAAPAQQAAHVMRGLPRLVENLEKPPS